jgi:hypothetical protein
MIQIIYNISAKKAAQRDVLLTNTGVRSNAIKAVENAQLK